MRDTAAQKRGAIIVVVLVVATLISALVLSGITGHIADAFSTQPYKCTNTAITAQVNSDGSLLITEQRTFTFKDKVTNIRWKHDSLSSTSKIAMRDLRVSIIDSNGNATSSFDLSAVPFQESWRKTNGSDGVGPTTPCYSIDDEYNTVYTYFDAQDATIVYTIDYTIQNGLQAWSDVAEINWTVVSSEWNMDSENVTVTLSLPEPVGVEAKAGENVYAWSHGPQNATIETNESAIITYSSPSVKQGQWALLHVAFPSSWLTNLPNTKEATQYSSQPRLTTILSSEAKWFDQSTVGKIRGSQFDIALFGICLALIALSLLIFLLRGRDFKPKSVVEPVDELPEECSHPAVAGRLLRWNHESIEDLTESIMRLQSLGAVSLEATEDNAEGLLIRRCATFDSEKANPIDAATLDFLFKRIANDSDEVSLAELRKRVESGDKEPRRAIIAWQRNLTEHIKQAELFDTRSFKWQVRLVVAAIILVIVGIALKAGANSNTLLGAGLPTAAIMALLGNYMPRRTQKGQDLAAQAYAFQKQSNESPSSDGSSRAATNSDKGAESQNETATGNGTKEAISALRDTLERAQINTKDTQHDHGKKQHRPLRFFKRH